MTVMLQAPPGIPAVDPDVPIVLHKSETGADRAFRYVLAVAAAITLAILVAVVVFLAVYGWPAMRRGGLGFFSTTWAPDLGRFGMVPLLVGSIAIAVVALVIALPISLATALMINEYLPPRLPAVAHRASVDLLATVPSIVYGFWGLRWCRGCRLHGPNGWSTTSASSPSSGHRSRVRT